MGWPYIKGTRTSRHSCSSGLFDPCGQLLFLENPLQGCTGTQFFLGVSVSNNKCAEGNAKRCLLLSWGYLCSIRFASFCDKFSDGSSVQAEGGIPWQRIRSGGSSCRAGMRAQWPSWQGDGQRDELSLPEGAVSKTQTEERVCWRELQSFYFICLKSSSCSLTITQ